MLKIVYITLSFYFVLVGVQAQEINQSYLNKIDDESLLKVFDEVRPDTIKMEMVARVYLERARREGDTIKMARGYDRLARIFSPKKNIFFADSIIELTKKIDNITYPGLAYLMKGVNYELMENIELEYENFLMAYSFAMKRNNITHKVFVLDRMATTQATFGDKNRALLLQKERDSIVNTKEFYDENFEETREENRDMAMQYYVNEKILSQRCFVYCYLMLKKYDKAKSHLDSLKQHLDLFVDGYSYKWHKMWFLDASMELNYYSRNFKSALEYSDSIVTTFDREEVTNSSFKNIFLFKGLSWIGLKEQQKGIEHLLKADSIFKLDTIDVNLVNDRLLYEKLNTYYDGAQRRKKKIEFLNRLIYFDSIHKRNYAYFEPKYIREIETPRLLEEKQHLIDSLEEKDKRNKALVLGAGILLFTALGFLGYYYRRQKLFRKRFEALVNNEVSKQHALPIEGNETSLDISPEIVSHIMEGLEKFERDKKFTNPTLNLNVLAKEMDTNSNYLSRVVNYKMGKGFSSYINDLRLEYCIGHLLPQELYRKFTIKAIAEECGYKNAESFSRGFFKKYGIYPSYYIKNIDKVSKAE